MIFITSYHSPDIDGVACCIGYSELLSKLGTKAETTYFGDLSREVEFVKRYTNFFPLKKHSGEYPEDAEFVLVDTADPDAIETTIPPERVKEIFKKNNLGPSQKVAVYLYSAIISNTVNFKNSVTAQRDINAANWLKPISQVGDDYIRKMFEYKSKIRDAW